MICLTGLTCCFFLGGFGDLYNTYMPSSNKLQAWLVYSLATVLGFTVYLVAVLAFSLATDMIGKNTSSSAFVYGCVTFTGKITHGLIVLGYQQTARLLCAPDELCGWLYFRLVAYGLGVLFLVTVLVAAILSDQATVTGGSYSKL